MPAIARLCLIQERCSSLRVDQLLSDLLGEQEIVCYGIADLICREAALYGFATNNDSWGVARNLEREMRTPESNNHTVYGIFYF